MSNDEFHPVLPNIVDESMRDADKDIETVKKRSRQKRNADNGPDTQNDQENYSWGRQIIIGVLVVIIIILVILLIYQIYKYYSADEIPLVPNRPRPTAPGPNVPSQPTDPPVVPKEQNSKIPEHVRNLDDSVLNQYINKNAKSKTGSNFKNVQHDILSHDSSPPLKKTIDTVDRREMDQINQIMDNTQNENDDIPTREEITEMMRQGIENDKQQSASLETIEEESLDSVIDRFEHDEDGCQFELTKGKNRGQICGRPVFSDTRCIRHKDK